MRSFFFSLDHMVLRRQYLSLMRGRLFAPVTCQFLCKNASIIFHYPLYFTLTRQVNHLYAKTKLIQAEPISIRVEERDKRQRNNLHFLYDLLNEQDFVNVEQELFVRVHEKDCLEMYELIWIHLSNFVVVQCRLLKDHCSTFSLMVVKEIFSSRHWVRREFQVVQRLVSC